MNLLESAGFSRANPYYVVQQGKVSQGTSLIQVVHRCIEQNDIAFSRQQVACLHALSSLPSCSVTTACVHCGKWSPHC